MTDFRHIKLSTQVVDSGSLPFNLFDSKGRELGIRWSIEQLNTRLATEADQWAWIFEDDNLVRFVGHTQTTRAGKRYGASVASIYGKTLEEVRQAIVARVTGCERRYTRLSAKGAIK